MWSIATRTKFSKACLWKTEIRGLITALRHLKNSKMYEARWFKHPDIYFGTGMCDSKAELDNKGMMFRSCSRLMWDFIDVEHKVVQEQCSDLGSYWLDIPRKMLNFQTEQCQCFRSDEVQDRFAWWSEMQKDIYRRVVTWVAFQEVAFQVGRSIGEVPVRLYLVARNASDQKSKDFGDEIHAYVDSWCRKGFAKGCIYTSKLVRE